MKWQSVSWSPDVERALAGALGSDSHIVRQEVEAGCSSLWFIEGHGYFVTRVEPDELVLVAWQGKNTGPLISYLKSICKKNGIKAMRFHTSHSEKLITRFVRKWGFEPVETVYRVEF